MDYRFHGVCPVVNVPFDSSGAVDWKSFANVIKFTLGQNVGAIALFAFNSEPHKMTFKEKMDIIPFFISAVNRRAETLVGLVDNSISGCIELGIRAAEAGANGVILFPPSLSTPGLEGLLAYFKTISKAVGLPVMLQDNPRSTGVAMSSELLIRAHREIDNFNYLKVECPIPAHKIRQLVQQSDGSLKCFSGNGGIHAVEAFLSGAWGIMPGVCTAGVFVRILNHLEAGDLESARLRFERALPLIWFEDQSLEFYIACEKALLKRAGIISCDEPRQPGYRLDDWERNELFILYDRCFRSL